MTRTDSLVVGTLVALLALIAGLVSVPTLLPAAVTTVTPSASSGPVASRPYREGVLGRPVSVSPLSAKTQADRDLVALVFAGLVRIGPAGTIVPDLAERWSVDDSGKEWTFFLRADARWHDGEPVTVEDVLFTIHALQDPKYTGPGAGSWREVTAETTGARTVVLTLKTPLGGFLQAATQPLAPAHILSGVPVDQLSQVSFGRQPIGAGPFAVASLSDDTATLIPAGMVLPPPEPVASQAPRPSDSLATQPPAARPNRPIPYLSSMEFRFYDDAEQLAAAYRDKVVDVASGLSPSMTRDLAAASDSLMLRYPGSTLTTVLLNLRPGHPEFGSAAVRTALLGAIDRSKIITDAFAFAAGPAPGLIPPASPLFDSKATVLVPFDPEASKVALEKAGWKLETDGWHLPKAKTALEIELLSPDQASNPATFQAAQDVARGWEALGLNVDLVPLPPGELVNGRVGAGKFTAAVVDVQVGLDPDLYPLLASSQTVTRGSNIIGLQDRTLDKLLVEARGPGTDEERAAAYAALQEQLSKGRYLLPLAFADETIVARGTLQGPAIRQIADPAERFWDVLTWRLAADR